MANTGVAIWCAKNSKNVVVIIDEITKHDGPFTCLDCDGILDPRKGPKNTHHFGHRGQKEGETNTTGCSGESSLHNYVKLRLERTLYKWTILVQCELCPSIVKETKFGKSLAVVSEKTVFIEGTRYIPDLLVTDGKSVCMAIEVCHSHAMPKEKRADMFRTYGDNNVFEICARDFVESEDHRDYRIKCKGNTKCERCQKKRLRLCKGCEKSFDLDNVRGGKIVELDNLYCVCEECAELCQDCSHYKVSGKRCPTCEHIEEEQKAKKEEEKRKQEEQEEQERLERWREEREIRIRNLKKDVDVISQRLSEFSGFAPFSPYRRELTRLISGGVNALTEIQLTLLASARSSILQKVDIQMMIAKTDELAKKIPDYKPAWSCYYDIADGARDPKGRWLSHKQLGVLRREFDRVVAINYKSGNLKDLEEYDYGDLSSRIFDIEISKARAEVRLRSPNPTQQDATPENPHKRQKYTQDPS